MVAKKSSGIDPTMFELFKIEMEEHARTLEKGILTLEKTQDAETVKPLMRAAHSIKGASKIVGLEAFVKLAHAMEDLLTKIQKGETNIDSDGVDALFHANDIFMDSKDLNISDMENFVAEKDVEIEKHIDIIRNILEGKTLPQKKSEPAPDTEPKPESSIGKKSEFAAEPEPTPAKKEEKPPKPEESSSPLQELQEDEDGKLIRVRRKNLNKLLWLAGEAMVQSRFTERSLKELFAFKESIKRINALKDAVFSHMDVGQIHSELSELFMESDRMLEELSTKISLAIDKHESFSRRHENTLEELLNEALATKMKPFSDAIHGFPRMMRDLEKKLNKKFDFEIVGENTPIDREILEKLEAPLTHLLRNAADHGIETPEERERAGKTPRGKIVLEARHRNGALNVIVRDDGGGVDVEKLREKIVRKNFAPEDMAKQYSKSEIIDFLFLPGFSTAGEVTDVSGRGVGLDVALTMLQEVGGSKIVETAPGEGTEFLFELPLTLSQIKALLVEIAGDVYAVPLSRIDFVLNANSEDVETIEDKQYIYYRNKRVSVFDSYQLFEINREKPPADKYPIIIISDLQDRFGVAVDSLIGKSEIVVRALNKKLGKIPNISSVAALEDGRIAMTIDADDVVKSVKSLISFGKLAKIGGKTKKSKKSKKRVLVVDDSLTVRETERKLLESRGYEVALAVDGVDGWNVVHRGEFDLVVSDVDMPRMNGFDLVRRIKTNPKLKDIPVVIVSYKDREEDKRKGLNAGANYYLAKSSFQDDALLDAVEDLIGR